MDYLFNNSWLQYALIALYVVTVLGAVGIVVWENRNPVKSLAWITVLLLLPGLGIIIYFVFGRNIRNTRMISRHNRRKLRRKESFHKVKINKLPLTEESKQLIRLSRVVAGAIYYPGNEAEVFTSGTEKFKALLHDIKNAEIYINIQYYIFSGDKIGQEVKNALIERAKAGVTVRVIYDSVGSYGTRRKFFKEMMEAGIQAYPFFKVVFPPFGTRINWRNHRKLCVIDGKVGYIGGMNVADRYIDGGKTFDSWRDTHLRIQGPAVGALQYSFAVDWNFMGRPLIEDPLPSDPGENLDLYGAGMQLLTSGATLQWPNIEMLFIKAIGQASHRIYVQTPYFLPTDALLKALQSASLSGVDVRVMMPKRSDSMMLDYASFSYFHECMQAGIKIYLYEAGMMHAKMMIVDYEFVSVGSTNFDFRSFEHNFESNIQIYSTSVNKTFAEIFQKDLRRSQRVDPEEWRKRSVGKRVAESVVRLLSPIM